jgi:hypothetical protein
MLKHMMVRDLDSTHIGRYATVDGRTGMLSYGPVPAYRGVMAWYLIIPMAHGPFPEAALSLQWGESLPVVLH